MEDALADIRKARELEPTVLVYQANYAMILFNARRHEEVIAFLPPFWRRIRTSRRRAASLPTR